MTKLEPTWDDLDSAIAVLAHKVCASGKRFDAIHGVKNGGMVIAVLLAQQLELPLANKKQCTAKTLIVDDVCRTGKTLKKYKQEAAAVVYKYPAEYSNKVVFWAALLPTKKTVVVMPYGKKEPSKKRQG